MPTTQIIRIYQKNLDALAAHYVEACIDDSEHIRIIRVFISAAVSILIEDGETDETVGYVESTLRENAREFYTSNCAKGHPEISNIGDYIAECAEMFDYIYINGVTAVRLNERANR